MLRTLSPLAVSLGDPAGIGPEVIAKCWDNRDRSRCRRSSRLATRARSPPSGTGRSSSSTIRAKATPRSITACRSSSRHPPQADRPGPSERAGAHTSLDSLEIAVGLARSGLGCGGGHRPGRQRTALRHRFPASRARPNSLPNAAASLRAMSSMMLAGPTLRDRSGHDPSAARRGRFAADQRSDRIARPRHLRGLQRNFGIAEPRLAVSGLNPHAGEGGQLGREEIEIIEPAIAALAAEGWRVTGPHPADTMFHDARARRITTPRCACTTTRR